MVVTFLVGTIDHTCQVLDNKRLNKQKVEAHQILDTITGKQDGWKNHPAVKMWQGYPNALKYYCNKITEECLKRGFKNTMEIYKFSKNQLAEIKFETIEEHFSSCRIRQSKIVFPWWFTFPPFILSHKAALVRKDKDFYTPLFLDVNVEPYLEVGYIWPHKMTEEQVNNFSISYCDKIGAGAPANYRWSREEVLEWISNDKGTNPKTGRKIKPTKAGIYADLTKAAKIYDL